MVGRSIETLADSLRQRLPRTVAWPAADGWAGLLAAVAVAALYALFALSPKFFTGAAPYWHADGADLTQYMSAVSIFLREPWHFPLLRIESLNYPQGTLLTFLDGIPIYTLILKVIDSVVPIRGNPLGLWVGLCFMGQGVAAWFLAREAGRAGWLVLISATLFLVSMPMLIYRIGHLALMGQFYIPLSFCIYLRDRRLGRSHVWAWSILLFCCFYTHLYLFGMIMGVFIASTGDLCLDLRRLLLRPALALLPLLVSVPPMMGWIGRAPIEGGFDIYSMNIFSPIIGSRFFTLPSFKYGTSGQYEGFNYLGLGLLLLWVVNYLVSRRRPAVRPTMGPILKLCLIGMAIYSLSNVVYFSDVPILTWSVPTLLVPITTTFRVAGRFFWPVAYAMVVFGVLAFVRLGSRWPAIGLLALAALQVVDVSATARQTRRSVTSDPWRLPDRDKVHTLLKDAGNILYFPKFRCEADSKNNPDLVALQGLVARDDVRLNTGHIARYFPECTTAHADIAQSDPASTTYVFSLRTYTREQALSLAPQTTACQTVSDYLICRRPRDGAGP